MQGVMMVVKLGDLKRGCDTFMEDNTIKGYCSFCLYILPTCQSVLLLEKTLPHLYPAGGISCGHLATESLLLWLVIVQTERWTKQTVGLIQQGGSSSSSSS